MTALLQAPRQASRMPAARKSDWSRFESIGRAPVMVPLTPSVPAEAPATTAKLSPTPRLRHHNVGPFAITLPDTWHIVAEHAQVLGRPMRMVIRETNRPGPLGGAMIYRIQVDGRSLDEMVTDERQIWEDLFAQHGHDYTFAGDVSGKDGRRSGVTFLRKRDGVAFYDTLLIVNERAITYGLRVYTPVDAGSTATDLQIVRSFMVKA